MARMEDAEALLLAYQAALKEQAAQGQAAPPCGELLAILQKAAETAVPISTLDLREVKVGRQGANALAAVLSADSYITFANLEGTDIGDEGAVAVASALNTHPTIFRLDLGYNEITGKGVKAIAGLLLESSSLLCLDLSGNNLYSLGEGNRGRLVGGLSMLAPASFSALAPLGSALASSRCKLQLLHLEKADIEHNNLGALVDGLLSNETLVNLRLGENGLTVRSAEVLGRLLRGNHTLTSLDLRENALGDAGCAHLGDALRENHGLRCLVLWRNQIGAEGVSPLASGLRANTTLQILDLGSNGVGGEAALVLKEALCANRSSALHTLGLADTRLDEAGGVAMAEVLEGNVALQRLDLRRNTIGVAGLMAIHIAMKANTAMLEIALDGVADGPDAQLQAHFTSDIKAACMRNSTATGASSSVLEQHGPLTAAGAIPGDLPGNSAMALGT